MDPFKGPGWCKFYADGSQYYATDPELRRKAKSWRNSSPDNIVMVMIRDKQLNSVRIQGTGEFWQSDTQMAHYSPNNTVPGVTVTRRIMKKINEHDKAILVRRNGVETFAQFHSSVPAPNPVNSETLFPLDPNTHVGMWFVIESDVATGQADYYLSPERV